MAKNSISAAAGAKTPKVSRVEQEEVEVVIDPDHPTYDQTRLPPGLTISTMTICGKMGAERILVENVGRYIELNEIGVVDVNYANKIDCCRTLLTEKKKKKATKPKKTFYNQVTVKVVPREGAMVNIKLFHNAAFQMTGCKRVTDCYTALNLLIDAMRQEIVDSDEEEEEDAEPKMFVDDPDKLEPLPTKIALINSNFSINADPNAPKYDVDLDALDEILVEQEVIHIYDPCKHVCVNIKHTYEPDGSIVSIFVFKSGSIIITGGKNIDHILSAYNYIDQFLEEHHSTICRLKMNDRDKKKKMDAILELLD